MVEMDRFVTRLSGSEEETLVRRSRESLATMKEQGGTLTRSEPGNFRLTNSEKTIQGRKVLVEKRYIDYKTCLFC